MSFVDALGWSAAALLVVVAAATWIALIRNVIVDRGIRKKAERGLSKLERGAHRALSIDDLLGSVFDFTWTTETRVVRPDGEIVLEISEAPTRPDRPVNGRDAWVRRVALLAWHRAFLGGDMPQVEQAVALSRAAPFLPLMIWSVTNDREYEQDQVLAVEHGVELRLIAESEKLPDDVDLALNDLLSGYDHLAPLSTSAFDWAVSVSTKGIDHGAAADILAAVAQVRQHAGAIPSESL